MVKKPTMKEIARLAGVSRPSVSMILNNRPYAVTEETRERVKRIARELNYKPNYFARSLKQGRTECIGFVNCFDTHPNNSFYYSQVIKGVEEELVKSASDKNLIMFGSSVEGMFEKSRTMMERGAVDGLILNILSQDLIRFEETVLPSLQQAGVPFVVIHSTARQLNFPNVGLNTYRGGELAAEHFTSLGYRTVGVHPSIIGSPRCGEPVEGFIRTMEKHGVPVTDLAARVGDRPDRHRLSGREAEQILADPPRALFIPDDVAVYELLAVAARRKTQVPGDVAVIGFDDIYTYPEPNRLTTLHHPFIEKGGAALQMLLRLMDDAAPNNGDYHQLIDPVLMVRDTCGGSKL